MFVKAWDEFLWLLLCTQDKAPKQGVGILRQMSPPLPKGPTALSDPATSTDAALRAILFQFKAGLLLRKMVFPLIFLLPSISEL